MTGIHSSDTTKKLLLRFVRENIEYRKRCEYLQEVISMGKKDDFWFRMLTIFFSEPMQGPSLKTFSEN